jgi:hypothetical protein
MISDLFSEIRKNPSAWKRLSKHKILMVFSINFCIDFFVDFINLWTMNLEGVNVGR